MKKQIFGAAVAAVLTVAAMAAYAEDSLPVPPTFHHGGTPHSEGAREPHDAMGPMGPMPPIGPGFAVINDLEQLRRLYALSGRPGDIAAVYHDVLNRTQDPMLRHYVYDSLAREQLKPANPEQAIATLRTSLSEDLAAIDKMPRPPFDRAPQSKP